MHCRIHRGSHEVGGSCVEVEYDGARLVLDLGRPLTATMDEVVPLPDIEGLVAPAPWLCGVVISHGHPDHYGLATGLGSHVPVFIGEATERILREAVFFSPAGADLHVAGHLRDRRPIALGPFTVTPYLADHSAFDAYSLLVEAGGRRLFYSADVRGHGRKRSFERLLADPPPDVHVILLEGTHVVPEGVPPRGSMTEHELEERCVELFRNTDGIVLAAYSCQNIDRLVTLYRAAKRAGRLLTLDLYGATVARATGRQTVPQSHWEDVRVFVPLSQRIRVKRTREFERVADVSAHRLYPEDLARLRTRLVLTFRGSMAKELDRAHCLEGAVCLWSMWPGYLTQDSGRALSSWLAERAIPVHPLHSSGHASVGDLQRLATALGGRVVPIHTAAPERYPAMFANVEPHEDGDWWPV